MSHCRVNSCRDEAALLAELEVAVRDNRVAVAPGGDVLLVEQVADARGHPASSLNANYVPRLAPVAGVRDKDVRVLNVGGTNETEAQRAVVGVAGGVESQGGVAGRLIGRVGEHRKHRPGLAAVEGNVRARKN